MSFEKIISDWKKADFKQVYLLHGEEEYYIDALVRFAEHNILSESESSFNLSIYYGKDADWTAVVNACRRYPMFSEKQVVLLKEAQMMKSINELERYVEDPLNSTIFIIAHKGKTLDKRLKLYKLIEKSGEVFTSAKIKEEKVHEWIQNKVKELGYSITPKCTSLLEEHVGNDLSRIMIEIEKLVINLGDRKQIDENDIEKYIGISKEYNIFELQAAIAKKDLPSALKIINYFESNPKAVPIQMALPALYSFISKVYSVYGLSSRSEATLKPVFYFNPNALNQAYEMMRNYEYSGIEKLILLLNHYNLKGVGVGDQGTDGAALMREMVTKMML